MLVKSPFGRQFTDIADKLEQSFYCFGGDGGNDNGGSSAQNADMDKEMAAIDAEFAAMDAAYDAAQIRAQSQALGHVPIIDRNPRRQTLVPMAPHEAARYQERTAAERCYGRFKDEFGGRSVQVRGPDKVMMHAMFGLITLFADQLLKVTGC
jgi:hypothetical protein